MKKLALLIGINDYQNLSKLKYARQDAEAVADALKKNYCFSDDEIVLLTDKKQGRFFPSTKGVIQRQIEELVKQGDNLDLFILGFWGHGMFRNGQRYLCPQTVMDEDVTEEGLSFDDLQKQLVNVKAKNTCIILDCCQTMEGRGGSETLTSADQICMENAARDIVFNKNQNHPSILSNVAILNSCSEGQIAYEWDERQHGLFTAYLLDAMDYRCRSVSAIVSYLGNKIKLTAQEMGKVQTPFFIFNGEGDIPLPAASSSFGDVFISYRHVNADLVKPVLEELKRRGISYFFDEEGIDYGMPHYDAIDKALASCKALLLFWTKEVCDNPVQINREVSNALDSNKIVVPYKIGSFEIPRGTLKHLLNNINHFEVSRQTPETIRELVNQIERTLPRGLSGSDVTPPPFNQNPNPPNPQAPITPPPFPPKSMYFSFNGIKINRKIVLYASLFLIAGFLVFCLLISASAKRNEVDSVNQPVSKSVSDDVESVRKAAQCGDAEAQYYLGLCFTIGEGVPVDKIEAVKWYRKAAEQGHPVAQYLLGFCYENGENVEKDMAEAVKWYREAAEQGNEDAINALKRLGGLSN